MDHLLQDIGLINCKKTKIIHSKCKTGSKCTEKASTYPKMRQIHSKCKSNLKSQLEEEIFEKDVKIFCF